MVLISSAVSILGCLFALLMVCFGVLIFWQIFAKAGYSGAWSLLMLVPLANVVALCILAFSRWPVQDELERLRAYASQWQGRAMPPDAPPGSFPPFPGSPPRPPQG